MREMLDAIFRGVETFEVGFSGIFDERGIVEANLAGWCDQATTIIAESVVVVFDVHDRVGAQIVGFA